jgi:hypothetical protein
MTWFGRLTLLCVLLTGAVHAADEWGGYVLNNPTIGTHATRACYGNASAGRPTEIVCPVDAPVISGGSISATAIYSNDSHAYFYNDFSNPSLVFDTDDYLRFNRAQNRFDVMIGALPYLRVTADGISSSNGSFTGNVGIGTTTPTNLLVLRSPVASYGAISVKHSDALAYHGLWLESSANSKGAFFGHNGTYAALGTTYTSGGDNYSNLVLNEYGGNVGIATTTPNATLQVSGSFTVSTSAQTTTPTLYANTSGNVGIGTSAPTTNLHVNGASSTIPTFRVSDDAGRYIEMRSASNLSNSGLTSYAGLFFGSSGSMDDLIIGSTGNVGIATTSPNAKLDVNGTISATALYVTSTGGVISGTMVNGQYASFTTLYAGSFSGDGSGLTGVSAATADRIVSGTSNATSMVAVSSSGYISITQAGANSAWFDPSRGLVALGVSTTGGISGSTGYFYANVGVGTAVPAVRLHAIAPASDPTTGATKNAVVRIETVATNVLNIGGTSQAPYGMWLQSQENDVGNTNYPLLLNPVGGNVGIGTTAPGTNFHVEGGFNSHQIRFGNGENYYWGVGRENSSTGRFSLINKSGVGAETEPLSVLVNGNVGIGIDAPTQRLHVQDTATTTALIKSTAGAAALALDGSALGQIHNLGNNHLYIDNGTANDIILRPGSYTESMRLKANGNIGIGTTTPAYRLDVSATNDVQARFYAGVGYNGGITLDTADAAAANAVRFANAGTNKWGLMHGLSSGAFDIYDYTAGVSRFKVTSAGYVGISTTTPNAELEVNGTISATNLLVNGVAVGGAADHIVSDTTSVYANDGMDTISFTTAGSTRMMVDSSGNVGIGTSAPAFPLHIAKDLPYIELERDSALRGLIGIANGSGVTFTSSAANDMVIRSQSNLLFGSSNNEIMRIASTGNVGIATTAPSLRLEVLGSTGPPASSGATQIGGLRIGSTTNSVLDFGNTDISPYGNWIQSTNRSNLALTYPLLLNPNGGNVGIGTTDPQADLHVSRDGAATQAEIAIDADANQASQLRFMKDGGLKWALYSPNSSDDLYLYDTAARVVFKSGGNVGIGTTNPNAKLEVAGTISSTGVSVTGIVTATYFEGNGSRLTGVTATTDHIVSDTTSVYANDGMDTISFTTAGSTRMMVAANGNVGVGTDAS